MTNIQIEGEESQVHEIPVNFTEEPQEVPQAEISPLADIPVEVKQEALSAKIDALKSGKTVKQAEKAQRAIVSKFLWTGKIEKAKVFFKWSAFFAIISFIYWLSVHDRLEEKYRPAREVKERAVKVAEAQYQVDIANIDLLESKK
jgi:hypothetical protein